MTAKDQAYVAEQVDRFQKFVTFGVLVLAVAYSVEVFQFLVSEETRELLKDVSFWMSILVILIIAPAVLQFAYVRFKFRKHCLEVEGFVLEAVKKASMLSFSLTFAFMVFMDGFILINDEGGMDWVDTYPPKFYLKIILAFTLFVQSLLFFWFTRSVGGEDA